MELNNIGEIFCEKDIDYRYNYGTDVMVWQIPGDLLSSQ